MFWIDYDSDQFDEFDELSWHWSAECVACGTQWRTSTDGNGLPAKALADLAEWAENHVCEWVV